MNNDSMNEIESKTNDNITKEKRSRKRNWFVGTCNILWEIQS